MMNSGELEKALKKCVNPKEKELLQKLVELFKQAYAKTKSETENLDYTKRMPRGGYF